jgi:hypothetical protein
MKRTKKSRQAARSKRPLIVFISGIILIVLAVVIWSFFPDQSAQAPGVPVPSSLEEIPRIAPADALGLWVDGSAIFVDVRTTADYQASHIPASISIPLDQLEFRANELNPEDWIITYCT